jgi:hypothetical protein
VDSRNEIRGALNEQSFGKSDRQAMNRSGGRSKSRLETGDFKWNSQGRKNEHIENNRAHRLLGVRAEEKSHGPTRRS